MEKSNPTYEELLKKVEEQEKEIQSLKANQNGGRKNLFQTLFTDSYSIMLIIDFETGQIINANKSACKFYGYSYDEITSMNIDQINTLSPEEVKKEMQNAKSEVRNYFNFKHKLKNEQIKDVEVHSGKILTENKICLYSIIHDVTENKQKETELEKSKLKLIESEQLYRDTFNHAAIGIAHVAPNGRFLKVNQKFCDIVGYTQNQLEKLNFTDITHPDDLELDNEQIEKVIANKMNSFTITKRYIHKNGKILWINLYSNVIREKNNQIKFAIASILDVTEQKVLQGELITAKEKAEESDRLKSAFLQNLSHEIRTPLNAICGFSGRLNKPNLSEEKRNIFVSIIQNSSNQLLSIISNVLTISALETNQEKVNIDKVCVNNIIVDLLAIFRQQSVNQNISLYAKQPLNDKQSEIYTDKTKITQILSNLISNAMKFTHEGFIEFGYSLKDNELEFYVKDSGIGIKAELQEKIFERFGQADLSINRKYGGTGLGLAISKGFTELLGGKIWVVSEIDKGSTFYFTIPYKPVNEPVNEIDNYQETQKQTNNKPVILVAEDEEFNFLYIEELLIDFDYKLIHAKDGQETVDIFKTNPDVSLILMDIKMPIMDGHKAAKLIKEIKPDLQIIAQSAYALEHEIEKYSGVFDDYLTKPISENDLKKIVAQHIENE